MTIKKDDIERIWEWAKRPENEVLVAHDRRLMDACLALCADHARLEAEVERLRERMCTVPGFTLGVHEAEKVAQAEVERLRALLSEFRKHVLSGAAQHELDVSPRHHHSIWQRIADALATPTSAAPERDERAIRAAARETKVPGLKSGHAIITPTCRKNRTTTGAFLEAAERLQRLYDNYSRAEDNQDVNWHLVLVREEPRAAEIEADEREGKA